MYLLGEIALLICVLVSLVFTIEAAITQDEIYWIMVGVLLPLLIATINDLIEDIK